MNDEHTPDTVGRRRFMQSAALTVGGLTSLSGCIEGPGGNDIREGTGYGAFFTLSDWGNRVGGDHFEFEDPVEIGEIGHGWDPDFDVIGEAATRELFLYLDTPEFAWAQNVAATLEEDHEDVTVLDLLSSLPSHELLTFAETREVGGTPDPDLDPDTFELGAFDIVDPQAGDIDAWWHENHWHGGLPDVPLGEDRRLSVHVTDRDGRIPPLGEDEPFHIEISLAAGAPEDVFEASVEGDAIRLTGVELGQSLLEFELYAGDQLVFETSADPLMVNVVDPAEIDVDVFHDPHTWVDPHLAGQMVEEIADTLADMDPDHAEDYAANAEAYISEIEAVEDQITQLVDEADHNHVVFAGHHSFGYVANRYNIQFHTPVGVSPDAEVTHEDVSGLIRVINDYDLDTVLYDPFEAPDPDEELPPMVDVLIEETGVSAEPLSAVEGTTPQWRDAGYGWLEQWTEINLPALEAALLSGQS